MVSMNRLTPEKRAHILHLLCEGSSIRAITRITGASKNTVTKLIEDVGSACAAFHDETVRGLTTKRVQVDEIWSFTYAKQKNVAAAKAAPDGAGDTWTWTGIDADSKLIVSWFIGARAATPPSFLSMTWHLALPIASSSPVMGGIKWQV